MPPSMDRTLTQTRTDARSTSNGVATPSTEDPATAQDAAARRSRFAGRRVHFIGIGGSGMSGLARMLLDAGAIVTGSEPTPNSTSLALAKRKVNISRDQI